MSSQQRAPKRSGFDLVLYSPRIPQNVGAIGRLCAVTGTPLHVVRPITFPLDDKALKRSAMDYWDIVDLTVHTTWQDCRKSLGRRRIFLLTKHADQAYTDVRYQAGDVLLFGNEPSGIPGEIRGELGSGACIRIPILDPRARCLNLVMSASVALYEAIRQQGY